MAFLIRSSVIILILIGISVYVFNKATQSKIPEKVEKKEEAVISVRQFLPIKKARNPLVFSIGTVEALDYTVLSSPVAADVLNVYVREGDRFSQGQSLLTYDLRSQEYDILAQKSGIEDLRAQLNSIDINEKNDTARLVEMERLIELAEKEYERNKILLDKNVVPLSKLESVERVVVQSRLEYAGLKNTVEGYDTHRKRLYAQLETGLVRLEQANLILEKAKIVAPFSGRVVRVHAAIGERMGGGSPLFDVFDPSKLRMKVALAQRYSALLANTQSISAKISNGQITATLSIIGVSPQVEKGNSSIDTYFALPDGDWILGSVWDVVISLPEIDAIAVRADSIYNDQYIYRVDEDNRVFEEKCERLGVTYLLKEIGVLLNCPTLGDNTSVIADQLPNLFNGVKVRVIETLTAESE